MSQSQRERLRGLIAELREFTFCSPYADFEQITAVTSSYMYSVVQLKHLAVPLLPAAEAERLASIDVQIDNWESAFEAKAEIDALIPDIVDAVDRGEERPPDGTACETTEGVRQLLVHYERPDLAAMLRRSWFLFGYESVGDAESNLPSSAVFRGPIEDCESLRALTSEDQNLILRALSEIHPKLSGFPWFLLELEFQVDRRRPTVEPREDDDPISEAQLPFRGGPLNPAGDLPRAGDRSRRAADYGRFEYRCQDSIRFPGTAPVGTTNHILVNGSQVPLGESNLVLLLRLSVELKKEAGGWVNIHDLQGEGFKVSPTDQRAWLRLRKELRGFLLDSDPKELIQNNRSGSYRISTHPDLVTYDKEKLLLHPSQRVRDLAKTLP